MTNQYTGRMAPTAESRLAARVDELEAGETTLTRQLQDAVALIKLVYINRHNVNAVIGDVVWSLKLNGEFGIIDPDDWDKRRAALSEEAYRMNAYADELEKEAE